MNPTNRRRFLAAVGASGLAATGVSQLTQTVAASDDQRPDFVPPKHDLHTHTTYSDGAHDLDLHIYLAQASGLDAVAVTDHCLPERYLGESEETFDAYVKHIERLRDAQDDLLILKGCEATAVDATGTVSLTPQQAERLDWVLCDLGGYSDGTLRNTPTSKKTYIENVIWTYMGICDVPYVDAIAHPFNTGNTSPAALPDDFPRHMLRELADKMRETNKAFDIINGHVYWFLKSGVSARVAADQYVELVRVFAEAGVRFQVSSDDHRSGLGNIAWPCDVLRRAGVRTEQLVTPQYKV
jgi:histidinol phosphatase-like PHP family hydrolase